MPAKWKKSRFKPEVILKKIDSVRAIDAGGRVSFSGFELWNCLPALQSMLEFPSTSTEVDNSTLVWGALSKITTELTPESLLSAINVELRDRLAKREQTFYLLTTVSLDSCDVPAQIKLLDVELRFHSANYPLRFGEREEFLKEHQTDVKKTPEDYTKVSVKVQAKSPKAALNKALRALDLQRSLWCLMENPRMESPFSGSTFSPINAVRLGSQHTLHPSSGDQGASAIWFEPNFAVASICRFAEPDVVKKKARLALQGISKSPYGERLISALVRFVRALDERDPNVAFIRLWSALESLTTPDLADYEKTVRRCAFLFQNGEYHRQLLEHLREYRNSYVHAGEDSDLARTHCFQLQLYFVHLIWFHLVNAKTFRSLDEANRFLDSPTDRVELERRLKLARKALRFTEPS
jgi:Apea-like HEPN